MNDQPVISDTVSNLPHVRRALRRVSKVANERRIERLERGNAAMHEAISTALRRLKHIDPVWAVGAAQSMLEAALNRLAEIEREETNKASAETKMSDTPRTDEAAYKSGYFHQHELVPASLARELERENAKLRELLQQATSYQPELRDGLLWYGFTPEFNARVREELSK